jgi:hypothetical protein
MANLTCRHCHRAITPPVSSGARLTCSHCQSPVDGASEKTSRWFIAHQNDKRGPYSWRALMALAARGDLDPDAMLIKEHSERWLRARSLHALFASAPAARTVDAAAPAAVVPQQPQLIQSYAPRAAAAQPEGAETQGLHGQRAGRAAPDGVLTPQLTPVTEPAPCEAPADDHGSFWNMPWVMEGLAAASISVLLGLSIVLGYYAIDRMNLLVPGQAGSGQHVANPEPDASDKR